MGVGDLADERGLARQRVAGVSPMSVMGRGIMHGLVQEMYDALQQDLPLHTKISTGLLAQNVSVRSL